MRDQKLIFYFLFIFSSITANGYYYESTISLQNRIEWNKNNIKLYSKGRLSIDYSNEAGFYCKAQENIDKDELVLQVPSEYLLCGFDLFPFKLELYDILSRIYDEIAIENNEDRKSLNFYVNHHLFIIYLSYIKLKDKSELYKSVEQFGIKEYNIKLSHLKHNEYLDSLPIVIHSSSMYEEEEIELYKILNNPIYLPIRLREVYDKLLNNLKKDDIYKKYGKSIIKAIESYNQYRYLSSILSTRAFEINIYKYEKFKNIDYSLTPLGKEQLLIYKNVLNEMKGECLSPINDLCNYSINNERNEIIYFQLDSESNNVGLKVRKSFKKGEEYSFSYSNGLSNLDLNISYGFYMKNNPFSKVSILLTASKSHINQLKIDILSKMKIMSNESINKLKDLQNNVEIQHNDMEFLIEKGRINNNLLNVIKILYLKTDKYDKDTIEKEIKTGSYFSFQNEILSLYTYINLVWQKSDTSQFTYYNLLQSIEITKKYFINRVVNGNYTFDEKERIKYTYELRRNIVEVVRELNYIIYKNILYSLRKMRKIVGLQIKSIKEYYN